MSVDSRTQHKLLLSTRTSRRLKTDLSLALLASLQSSGFSQSLGRSGLHCVHTKMFALMDFSLFLKTLNLDNYAQAISRMDLPLYFWNTALITIPAVFLTLFFGSLIAFVVSRYSFKWNVSLLLAFHSRKPSSCPACIYPSL
jgi:ABC-type glycerol-3-phosphate transport system permease component